MATQTPPKPKAQRIAPMDDRLLLREVKPKERTLDSGLILPGMVKSNRESGNKNVWLCEVIAVGPGRRMVDQAGMPTQHRIPVAFPVGAFVFIERRRTYSQPTFDGVEYLIAKEEDILCAVDLDEADKTEVPK